MKKLALLVSLVMPCVYAMQSITKRMDPVIKLVEHEAHFSSRTVGDKRYHPNILVMHYTAEDLQKTIEIFTDPTKVVSAHYIISEDGILHQNIEERNAAHHAGAGYWRGITGTPTGSRTGALNLHSLGIEHVNMGYRQDSSEPYGIFRGDREWYQFDERQMYASIKLSQRLVNTYHIKPEDVVAHGDIAPKRKVDPGPLFPWKSFADNCVGAWPDPEASYVLPCFEKAEETQDEDKNAMTQWTIKHLHHWGYKLPDDQDQSVPEIQRASAQDIIKAFQMHFRPQNIEGIVDPETATILKSLLCQYKDALAKCPCQKKD